MATTVTHYLDPDADAGGDGTTNALTSGDGTHAYNNWEDYETDHARDLTAADEIAELICCSNDAAHTALDGLTATDVAFYIDNYGNWTTDATRYISIKADAASTATAKWSDAKFRAKCTNPLLQDAAVHVVVEGLQFDVYAPGNTGQYDGLRTGSTAPSLTVINCYIRKNSASTVGEAQGIRIGGTSVVTARNTVIDGFRTSATHLSSAIKFGGTGASTLIGQNLTIVNCDEGILKLAWYHYPTITLTNCGFSNVDHPNLNPTDTNVTITTCSTDTPQFLDTDDYHLDPGDGTDDSPGDTVWRDLGTDLSATFTDDIDGETRPTGAGTWDIGADQSSTPTTPLARTMVEALRNPFATIHWLLEMDIGGTTRRFADAGLSIGTRLYTGALVMDSAPALEVDPYTALASATTCTISLVPVPWDDPSNPMIRPCDLEDATTAPIIGTAARVYRWAEDTDESERELIIDGNIIAASADGNGTIALEVSDFSVWYSRYRLPWYVVTEELWPDGQSDDRGLRAPICYGTFGRVKVPNTHAANDYHLISHPIASFTAAYVGDTSIAGSLTNTTDSDGTPIAQLDFSEDSANNVVMATGTGAIDDADGSYTGTASALITHVADQLRHLAVEFVGIPADKIDAASFAAVKSRTPLWVNALVVEDGDSSSKGRETKVSANTTDYFTVAQNAMLPYVGACFHERGKLTLRIVDTDKPARYGLLENGNLLNYEEIAWSGEGEEIPSALEIGFDWGWSVKYSEWRSRQIRQVKTDDYPPFTRAYQAGAAEKIIDARHIRDSTTVDLLIDHMKSWYAKPRRRWTVVADRELHPVNIFDVISVTASKAPSANGLGFVNKRGIVVGISYGLGSNTLTLLEA